MKLAWQLAGTLLVVAVVMHWLWWIVLAITAVVAVRAAKRQYLRAQTKLANKNALDAELIARADQQHAWTISGDHRGTYGESSNPESFI